MPKKHKSRPWAMMVLGASKAYSWKGHHVGLIISEGNGLRKGITHINILMKDFGDWYVINSCWDGTR